MVLVTPDKFKLFTTSVISLSSCPTSDPPHRKYLIAMPISTNIINRAPWINTKRFEEIILDINNLN